MHLSRENETKIVKIIHSAAPMSIVFYHLFFRTLTFLYLPVHNFWLLLCPNALSYDWQMGSIPLVHSFQDPRAALAIPAFYGILLLASMSVLYQRYGNKNAATRDVSKQNGSMDLSVRHAPAKGPNCPVLAS